MKSAYRRAGSVCGTASRSGSVVLKSRRRVGSPTPSHTPVSAGHRDAVLGSAENTSADAATADEGTTIVKVLEYIRSTFSSESVLDALPLEAAANPGAYHAWRAYRAGSLPSPNSPSSDSLSGAPTRAPDSSALGRNRRPGAWNWEGVWEERVRKAVKASLSEPVLFGGTSAGEDIVSLPNPCPF